MKNVIIKRKEGVLKMASKMYDLETEVHVWRAKKRMTQQQLAELTGVSRQTIMQIENTRYNPSLMLAHAIAEALGAEINDLFIFTKREENS